MILFPFTINKSFLECPNHPITIPKKYHASLISSIYQGNGCRAIPILIDPPAKRILDGKIYYGISGRGEYYQIKVLGEYPSVYFCDLKIGDIVYVVVARSGEKINVKIASPKELRGKIDNILSPTKKVILRKANPGTH